MPASSVSWAIHPLNQGTSSPLSQKDCHAGSPPPPFGQLLHLDAGHYQKPLSSSTGRSNGGGCSPDDFGPRILIGVDNLHSSTSGMRPSRPDGMFYIYFIATVKHRGNCIHDARVRHYRQLATVQKWQVRLHSHRYTATGDRGGSSQMVFGNRSLPDKPPACLRPRGTRTGSRLTGSDLIMRSRSLAHCGTVC